MGLRAGIAEFKINPEGTPDLFGYPSLQRTATGIHDPLLACAVHLRTGSSAIILISLDLYAIDPPMSRRIKEQIAQATSVKAQDIILSCTHTHSAPAAIKMLAWTGLEDVPAPDADYISLVENMAVKAAAHAMATTQPAEFAWTHVDVKGLGGNRFSSDGPAEDTITVCCVREPESKTVFGIWLSYGMHPTTLPEKDTEISADFPHYIREELKESFGSKLGIIYHTGACADQDPRHFISEQSYEEAERIGRTAGKAIAEAINAFTDDDYNKDPHIASAGSSPMLSKRKLPSSWETRIHMGNALAALKEAKAAELPQSVIQSARKISQGARTTVMLVEEDSEGEVDALIKKYKPFDVQAIRIDDLYIAGMPGEFAKEYADRLRQETDGKVFVVNFANGDMQGYILSSKDESEGRFEAAGSVFGHETGDKVINRIISHIEKLK